LTEEGLAKIMDFCLAKLEWGVDLTKTATIMGTAAYMSPEQAKGQDVDHRTDIWSLGAMLYEMMSGARPFKSEPDYPIVYICLMDVLGQKGLYDEAIAAGEKMLALGVRATGNLGVLAAYYSQTDQKEKSLELISELKDRSEKGYVSSFWMAAAYSFLGDLDKAFEYFERAYDEQDGNLIFITAPPPFRSIWPDPRYKSLLKKMGLTNIIKKQESGELDPRENNRSD